MVWVWAGTQQPQQQQQDIECDGKSDVSARFCVSVRDSSIDTLCVKYGGVWPCECVSSSIDISSVRNAMCAILICWLLLLPKDKTYVGLIVA